MGCIITSSQGGEPGEKFDKNHAIPRKWSCFLFWYNFGLFIVSPVCSLSIRFSRNHQHLVQTKNEKEKTQEEIFNYWLHFLWLVLCVECDLGLENVFRHGEILLTNFLTHLSVPMRDLIPMAAVKYF